jgi:hypothetical protein
MLCSSSSSAAGRRFDIAAAKAACGRQLLANLGDRCERGFLMHYQPTSQSTVMDVLLPV